MPNKILCLVFALSLVGCRSWFRDVSYAPPEKIAYGSVIMSLYGFRQDIGRYPTTEEGLESLARNPGIPGWRGPYVSADFLPYLREGFSVDYSLISGEPRLIVRDKHKPELKFG